MMDAISAATPVNDIGFCNVYDKIWLSTDIATNCSSSSDPISLCIYPRAA